MSKLPLLRARIAASISRRNLPVHRSAFARDVFKMIGASGASQLIAMAAYPLLTRLYDPTIFGLFGLVLAVVTIAVPLTTLRFEWALPIARGARAGSGLLVLGALIPGCAALLLAASVWVLRPVASPYVAGPSYLAITLGALFCLVTLGWSSIGDAWCVRQGEFGRLAVSRFASGTCLLILQIIFALLAPSVYGLIYGFAIGQLAAAAIAAASAASFLRPQWRRALKPASLIAVAKRFRKFAIITAPCQAISALGVNLPQMAIAALYGIHAGGLFALAVRVCGQPSTLMQGISSVNWARTATLVRTDVGRLRRDYITLTAGVALMALPGLSLFLIGEPLFALIFGPQWEQAGYFTAILFIGEVVGLAANSTDALLVFGRNAWFAAWGVGRLLLQIAVLPLSYLFNFDVVTCIFAISVAR
jgi:O-antigen/teichoic acid export membrane protein